VDFGDGGAREPDEARASGALVAQHHRVLAQRVGGRHQTRNRLVVEGGHALCGEKGVHACGVAEGDEHGIDDAEAVERGREEDQGAGHLIGPGLCELGPGERENVPAQRADHQSEDGPPTPPQKIKERADKFEKSEGLKKHTIVFFSLKPMPTCYDHNTG